MPKPTSKRPRAPRPLNFAEQLRKIDQRSAWRTGWRAHLEQRRAAKAEAKARSKVAPPMPQLPDLDFLTVADRKRVTDAMGVDMPMPEGAWGVQPDERLSKQLADQFLVGLARREGHEQQQHNAAIERAATGLNAREASVADVNATLQALGIRLEPHEIELHEPGKPLQPPPQRDLQHAAMVQRDNHREAARVLSIALDRGMPVDMRRLPAAVVQELLSLRGAR